MKPAHLADELHFAITNEFMAELRTRLQGAAPDEACVFVLTQPSRGNRRFTILLGKPLWPVAGEVSASPQSLDLSPDYVSRALDAAIDAGPTVGLVLIHTHPASRWGPGVGRFSDRDDWYDERLFGTICPYRRTALSGSLVFGANGSIDGRSFFMRDKELCVQRAHVLRVVGPKVRMHELAASAWIDHPDPEVMDRSTRIWGIAGRRRMQNLRAAVVGCGGTGTVTATSIATMGVGAVTSWDKDKVTKSNLPRLLGLSRFYMDWFKSKALEHRLAEIATASPFVAVGIVDWGTSSEALKSLLDYDVVFSCGDSLACRVPLNDLAYRHLIPVIDIASWLHQSDDIVDAMMTHAQLFSPGMPCAWCNQTLSSRALTLEAQGKQRNAEKRAGYGLKLEEHDDTEPSVLPLNVTGVGMALMLFMQTMLGVSPRTPHRLKLHLPAWELDESDLAPRHDCACREEVAVGDSLPIREVLPPP